jgi:hypothetical protein
MFFGDVTVTYTVSPAPRCARGGVAGDPGDRRAPVGDAAGHFADAADAAAARPGEAFAPGIGYAIPNRARELLTPYVVPNVA